MKLKNKKTGEIVEVESLYLTQTQELYLNYINEENKQKVYMTDKIASFNLDWEDYEAPKEYWYIIDGGEVHGFSDYYVGSEIEEAHREIGNLFEIKEEAEKAVAKLKAWKRLKDKGFIIYSWDYEFDMVDKPAQTIILRASAVDSSNTDLDLLFGGEE